MMMVYNFLEFTVEDVCCVASKLLYVGDWII